MMSRRGASVAAPDNLIPFDEFIAPEQLKPHPENPRQHTTQQLAELKRAIQVYKWGPRIQLWLNKDTGEKTYTILAGEGRWLAATELKAEGKLPAYLGGKVPCQWMPLTEKEAIGFMIGDNRATDLSTWNWTKLGPLLVESLQLGPEAKPDDLPTGFTPDDIRSFVTYAPEEQPQGPDSVPDTGIMGPDDRAGRFILVWETEEHKAYWAKVLGISPDTKNVVLTPDRLEELRHEAAGSGQ
jgi:hypothetical protein